MRVEIGQRLHATAVGTRTTKARLVQEDGYEISFREMDDGSIKVSADSSIVIEMIASNCFVIHRSKF